MIKAPFKLQDLRRRLYVKAKAERTWRFWGLYVHVCKRETLWEAYQLAKENNGAPGVDGVTFQAIEAEGLEGFLEQLREELVQRRYRPRRLRKVGIPKEGGKVRQLSIPCIRDRVVQGALKLILEPIFEADFQPGSFGYRPKKSAHAAIQRVSEAIVRHMTYVVDLDLRAYFDTVRHSIVLEKVAQRVNDAEVLWLLKLLLKASGKQGVPQGGVISPLLANIYLHYVLDCWYMESVKPRLKGRTFLVRFADDFILGFENKEDAEKVYRVLFRRFEKYGLSLHAEKTRLVPFGRPADSTEPPKADGPKPGIFDFLGFTHYWGRSRKGQWVIRRKTSRKRFGRSLKRVRQWCRENLHEPLRVQVEGLGRKLKGHFGYFGITGNSEALRRYRREVIKVWRKWLARRGGPQGMPWERMHRLLAFFYLPAARVVHSIYAAKP